jgi:hypothetical protein
VKESKAIQEICYNRGYHFDLLDWSELDDDVIEESDSFFFVPISGRG